MRKMKFHIFNKEDVTRPLCWGACALEFDTLEDAKLFIESIPVAGFKEKAIISECIYYYDGGHLNASGKMVSIDEETGEEILIDRV